MKQPRRILVVDKSTLRTGKCGITALPPELLADESNQDWILVVDNQAITVIKSRTRRDI